MFYYFKWRTLMRIAKDMDLYTKLNILTDAAKYDVACTSSGVERRGSGKGMGNCSAAGICHSFSADGRCIALLKIHAHAVCEKSGLCDKLLRRSRNSLYMNVALKMTFMAQLIQCLVQKFHGIRRISQNTGA